MGADHLRCPGAPVIRLSLAAHDELRRHAEESWPRESCGVLLGRLAGEARTVAEALRCRNVDPAPERRYQLDPRELLAAVKRARRRGEEILGFYHSHPDGPARPSAADLFEAEWPGCAYLVTAVAGGRAGATRAFVLLCEGGAGKRFAEEPVEAAPDPTAPAQAGG